MSDLITLLLSMSYFATSQIPALLWFAMDQHQIIQANFFYKYIPMRFIEESFLLIRPV